MHQFFGLSLDVIQRFRKGDESAFKEIYDRYANKIYAFSFSFLKDRNQSEEIVQETFISLWESRNNFDETKFLEPYLFTISKRLVLDYLRKQTSNIKMQSQLIAKISDIHNETENNIIYTDLLNYVDVAVKNLPKQQQAVFKLSRYEGLSFSEIATQLNLSENTVKNHLVVALKKLKIHYKNQEISLLFLAFLGLY